MPQDEESQERAPLLNPNVARLRHRYDASNEDAASIISSAVSKEERALAGTAVGERLPYNDYTTIDWLHDLIKDSFRYRAIHSRKGLKAQFYIVWDNSQAWVASALIGLFTALVAFVVDVAAAAVSDWKTGYCSTGIFQSREICCAPEKSIPFVRSALENSTTIAMAMEEPVAEICEAWKMWSGNYWGGFGIYVGFAVAYGLVSGAVTMTTKANLPSVGIEEANGHTSTTSDAKGKTMYMAAGSGIPEIKTILSGFVIPGFLDFKVLIVKAVGSIFAVSTGMCLGKEGPFVHISTCAGWLVSSLFPKYSENGRKMREMLSVACSAGLSVAFGAPIGGVLFSYEEISTYFPRKVLWRAFLCSLTAAVVLKALNPTGAGKLILFETNYRTEYAAIHYPIFLFLGVAGGIFGGVFCRLNYLWTKTFRKYSIIKNHPVFEIFLVVLVTAVIQYPNPLTREPGDIIIKTLLVDCGKTSEKSWLCIQEEASSSSESKLPYYAYLIYGTTAKLALTIITFGIKVPSGIIIPALDAGAFFGRLVGQFVPGATDGAISPGIFAMVSAAAFLAGVSRMTVSLTVIMFELTGEVDYIPPFMIAILTAKWVADALSEESVYDLAQTVMGHPFLDVEHAVARVRGVERRVEEVMPPEQTMREITVLVPADGRVERGVLREKLGLLRGRGLMDAGLVLVDSRGMLVGYLAEGELEFVLDEMGGLELGLGHGGEGDGGVGEGEDREEEEMVDLLDGPVAAFVDRTPLTVCAKAPMEYAVVMFGALGLRYLIVTEEGARGGRVVGVVIKKRLVLFLEGLHDA